MSLGMYKVKKKKVVDPNAPPRPNLLNHEKRIKDLVSQLENAEAMVRSLRARLEALESKNTHQTAYLTTLHQHIARAKKG